MDTYRIFVFRGRSTFGQLDLDFDIGLSAGCQAAHFRQAPSLSDGGLESAAGMSDIAQEANGIQEVRLARSIRTDDDDAITERNVKGPKVAPVLEH